MMSKINLPQFSAEISWLQLHNGQMIAPPMLGAAIVGVGGGGGGEGMDDVGIATSAPMSSLNSSALLASTSHLVHNSGGDPSIALLRVEAEVARVSAALEGLLSKVHDLKAQINLTKCAFLRILPAEIVSEIFVLCLGLPMAGSSAARGRRGVGALQLGAVGHEVSEDTDVAKMGRSTLPKVVDTDRALPLRLGAVCSAWRSIAWSTPRLWSSVALHLRNALKISTQAQLLSEWLSRSGHLPLSIWLSSSEDVAWGTASADGILRSVSGFSDRWRDVDIRLPSMCYRSLPQPAEGFPMLESLTLRPPGGQGDRTHKIAFMDAPKLFHLNLQCLYLRSIRFQWELVTSLELESFYVDESLEMLRQAVNLVEFTAKRILGGDDRHMLPEEPLVLPALEKLVIVNDKGTNLETMLSKISAPAMRFLSFGMDGVTIAPSANLISFLVRSECALETLAISSCALPEEDLELVLATVPSLKRLSLDMPATSASAPVYHFGPITDGILKKCDPAYAKSQGEHEEAQAEGQEAEEKGFLLPNLEVLDYKGMQAFSWEGLMQMVHSRMSIKSVAPTGKAAAADAEGESGLVQAQPVRLKGLNLRLLLFTEEQISAVPLPCALCHGQDGLQVTLGIIAKIPPPPTPPESPVEDTTVM